MNDNRFADVRRLGGQRYAAFIAAGFREFYSASSLHSTPFLLQKCIRDNAGTKLFFISVWCFDWEKWQAEGRTQVAFSFEFDCQFNGHSDQKPTFNVALFDHGQGPEEVGAFFAKMYEAMECQPYGD